MATQVTLTERRIRDAKPEAKTYIMRDRDIRGFGVRVTPTGAKAYVLDYRASGRRRLATLARCSELGLKEARERAGRELTAIRDGAADPLRRRKEAREAPTVAAFVERFFDYCERRVADDHMSPRTAADYHQQCTRYLLPSFGRLRVAEVKRQDIESAVAGIKPVQRNRVLALMQRLFTLAEHWELRPQHTNPARGVERAREEPRDRVLTPSELAALSGALSGAVQTSPAAVAAIRFAAMTGLRIGEVIAVRWEHIDFETGRLTLPSTKTGRRVHKLPTVALEILAAAPRLNGWCFTTGRGGITYKTARAVFVTACKRAGLADVRLHDLRRTVMTSAAAAGVGTHVLRDLLGHKTTAMADRYVRAVGNPVHEAREQVGATMAAMMDGKPGEVVPLRKGN